MPPYVLLYATEETKKKKKEKKARKLVHFSEFFF